MEIDLYGTLRASWFAMSPMRALFLESKAAIVFLFIEKLH
jgi:hypothetical protein